MPTLTRVIKREDLEGLVRNTVLKIPSNEVYGIRQSEFGNRVEYTFYFDNSKYVFDMSQEELMNFIREIDEKFVRNA